MITALKIDRNMRSLPMRRAGVPVLRVRCDFILSWPAHIVADLNRQYELWQTMLGCARFWPEYVPHDN